MDNLLSQCFALTCVGFIILLGFGVMFRRVDVVFNLVEMILRQAVELTFYVLRLIVDLTVHIIRALFNALGNLGRNRQ